MINDLCKLLSIESVAVHGKDGYPFGPGPAEALEYVLQLCCSFGFRTKNADGKYGYAEIGQGDELIGILAHLDVVPAGDGWSHPPFQGTVDGERLYGRGSTDDKGPAIASIYAMKDLLDSDMPLNKRIRLIFGQTEENGDWLDIEAYKENEEIPNYGFTPDGDFPALYGEKGIMLVTLKMNKEYSGFSALSGGNAPNAVPDFVSGVLTGSGETLSAKGKATHGCAPWGGDNAITKLMVSLARRDSNLGFVKMYMAAVGDSYYGQAMGIDLEDKESGKLSMNAGMIKDEGDSLTLYLDIRYPVTFNEKEIMSVIENRMAEFPVDVELIHHMKPVYMDKNGPVMKKLLGAYRDVTGDMSEPLVIGGGTYARSMDNIIAFGPTFPGHENREHKEDEYILIDDLMALRQIYRKALENLLYE